MVRHDSDTTNMPKCHVNTDKSALEVNAAARNSRQDSDGSETSATGHRKLRYSAVQEFWNVSHAVHGHACAMQAGPR